jgi:hypothetical protein
MKSGVGIIAGLYLSLLALLTTGCAYSVHQVYVSDFQPYKAIEQGDIVKGKGEQFVILGFTKETNYVEEARANLMKECPEGTVSGITTQISTSLGFFSWTNKALMQGLCIRSHSAESHPPPHHPQSPKMRALKGA